MVIEWSPQDGVYVITLPEWGSGARTLGATYAEAVRSGQDVLALLIERAQEIDRRLPPARVFAATA